MFNYQKVKRITNFIVIIRDNFKNILWIFRTDALLSVPGSGRHIERTTQFLSRVLYAAVNLFQMKEITNYMLNKIDVEEQRLRMTK